LVFIKDSSGYPENPKSLRINKCMKKIKYDIIVIGADSGGLGVSLFIKIIIYKNTVMKKTR
jgi:hypothetical protein